MNVVFDFGGVLFNWRPPELLARTLPQHVHDAASAQRWVRDFFQGYGGDWGDFDRGTVEPPALVQRIAARAGGFSMRIAKLITLLQIGFYRVIRDYSP